MDDLDKKEEEHEDRAETGSNELSEKLFAIANWLEQYGIRFMIGEQRIGDKSIAILADGTKYLLSLNDQEKTEDVIKKSLKIQKFGKNKEKETVLKDIFERTITFKTTRRNELTASIKAKLDHKRDHELIRIIKRVADFLKYQDEDELKVDTQNLADKISIEREKIRQATHQQVVKACSGIQQFDALIQNAFDVAARSQTKNKGTSKLN